MYSTARRLSAVCFILSMFGILGLIMVFLFFISLGLAFYWVFALTMFMVAITLTGLLLTVAIRSHIQDMELEFESDIIRSKKLSERIAELERRLK